MYNLNINPRLIFRNDKVAAGDERGLVRSQVMGAIRSSFFGNSARKECHMKCEQCEVLR